MLRVFILASITALAFTGCDDNDGGRVISDGGADGDGDGGANDDGDGGAGDEDPDAGAGGGSTLDCGDETCDLATEECCVDGDAPGCVDQGTCEGPAFTCDGPADCSDDQICCAGMNGGTGGTSCGEANECGGSVICASQDDCEEGEECCEPQSTMTPVGGFCANNCPGPG